MGDANPIRTLGDYSKPSHEGYRNTIELPVGNNVVPLRSDTIRLVQNGCSFHGLRSEDPNQHLKDFLKLVDSLDLDGSITTWEDLTTRFLAQFFPPGRNAKLRNDILMFQLHHGESLSEAWTRFKDLLQKVPHRGFNLWLQVQIFNDHVNPVTRRTIDQSAGDVPSTSDRRLIELENQVQRLMEAHLAPMQPAQVNKITSSCEICNSPHDTQYCMENPKQAFVDYASSPQNSSFSTYSSNYQTRLEKALIDFDSHQEKRLSSLRAQLGQQQDDMISKINLLWKTISEKLDDTPIQQNRNPSSPKRVHFINSIVILNKEDESKEDGDVKTSTTEYEDHEMTVESEEEFEEETEEEIEEEDEDSPKHFDTFPTMKELRYHEWLLKNPRPPWVKAKVRTGNLNNVKFSCMIGHFDKKQAYLDMESPINVMSRLHYNWIMIKRLGPRRKPSNPGKICNFVGKVKGLKVFVGNFTYECDFMVLEDTTSVIDHDLGSVVF
ncbi:MAK10-like protein [Tanacetum coccineum]